MNSFYNLVKLFSEFPGIGPRQAKRFVYFLLSKDKIFLREFKRSLEELEADISMCSSCFRYFQKNLSPSLLCPICNDTNRSKEKLIVVARDVDLENIEKTGIFDGYYFVLGGTVPVLEKNPEKKVRIDALKKRIEQENIIKEIILAMNANPEGDNTEEYIRESLHELIQKKNIKVSVLGRGLSTGVELEYSDTETLKNALSNRH